MASQGSLGTLSRWLRSILDVASTIAVILAAGGILWNLYSGGSPAGNRPAVQPVDALRLDARTARHVRGNGSVALVEFSDYECPFCAQHARVTEPELTKTFVDSGEIRHVVFNFPLAMHARAPKAGEAAECAGLQGHFWQMRERLFDNPGALETRDLMERAEALGLDMALFGDCLNSGATRDKVGADMMEGQRLNVNSTPAFFLGTWKPDGTVELLKRINGAVPASLFVQTIRDLRGRQ
jgi:protein-disulfide isomerase